MGHNLLLIDERAHGRSEGRTITFGIQERWDVESWARFAVERFGADVQIILYGVSMGAATVLMAAGLDLPENVKRNHRRLPLFLPQRHHPQGRKGYAHARPLGMALREDRRAGIRRHRR